MKDDDRSFRERLRKKRLEHGLSPGELAIAVGVTEGAVRQMESGQTKSASFAVGVKLALALGCSPYWLATGREKPSTADFPRDSNIGRRMQGNRPPHLESRLPPGFGASEGAQPWASRSELEALRAALLTLGQKLGVAAELEAQLLQETPPIEATQPAKATPSRRASGDQKAR